MMAYMKKSITINKHTYGKAYNKIIKHGELLGMLTLDLSSHITEIRNDIKHSVKFWLTVDHSDHSAEGWLVDDEKVT